MNRFQSLLNGTWTTLGIAVFISGCAAGPGGSTPPVVSMPETPKNWSPDMASASGNSIDSTSDAVRGAQVALNDAAGLSSEKQQFAAMADTSSGAKDDPAGSETSAIPDLSKLAAAETAAGSGGGSAASGTSGTAGSMGSSATAANPQLTGLAAMAANGGGAIYNGGGGGKRGAGAPNFGFGDSGAGAIGAGAPAQMAFKGENDPSLNHPPMGSSDPSDYFSMLNTHDDLFKIVERRYQKTSMGWASIGLMGTQPASVKK